MNRDKDGIIDIPSNFASRISVYLKEISDITSDIEDMLGEKYYSTGNFDSDLLKTLQNLDFVRQATADSARLMDSVSLSLIDPIDEIIQKLHLEKTVSVLRPVVKADVEGDLSKSGDIQMF